jgi:hypothetical protein
MDKHEKKLVYSYEIFLKKKAQKNDLAIFDSLTNP